jgi:hypothetical protein
MCQLSSFFLILLLLSAGCGILKPDPVADELGRRIIHQMASGNIDGVLEVLEVSKSDPEVMTQLHVISDSLAAEQADSIVLIGYNNTVTVGGAQGDLTYELHGQRWMLVGITWRRRGDTTVAIGLHYQWMPASMASINAFTISGRSWKHFLVLGLAVVCFLVSLITAIVMIRTTMPRRWLWAFVSIIGIGGVGINWSTGQTWISPSSFNLFSAGFLRLGSLGPWSVSFAVPLGAMLALWQRREFLSRQAPANVAAPGNLGAPPEVQ